MARINLLPWRESQRKNRAKTFYMTLGFSTVLAASIVFYINLYINSLIENQMQRNKYLQGQIAILDKQIRKIEDLKKEKDKLLAHIEMIHQLQMSRPQIVRILDEIVRTLPSGIYLENIKRQDHVEVLDGVAESNARISLFMRNLDASPIFQNSRLEIIEKKGKDRSIGRRFTLIADENKLSSDKEGIVVDRLKTNGI